MLHPAQLHGWIAASRESREVIQADVQKERLGSDGLGSPTEKLECSGNIVCSL